MPSDIHICFSKLVETESALEALEIHLINQSHISLSECGSVNAYLPTLRVLLLPNGLDIADRKDEVSLHKHPNPWYCKAKNPIQELLCRVGWLLGRNPGLW